MQVEVGAKAEPQLRASRQQRRREVERDAIELVAEHPAHPDVAPRHQRQGRQEVLTELLVGDPGRIGRSRWKDRWSMSTGWTPRNWTLYAVASLSVQPMPSAAVWTSSVRSAASRSWPNVHS